MTTGIVEPGRGNVIAAPGHAGGSLSRCLSLDLEVVRRDGRIHAFAGVRPDLDKVLTFPARRATLPAALDELADGADFVQGHNLIGFDLPHLQSASPQLRLMQLPAVDTLRLNTLAFPKNPYHYLVKHYQDGQLKWGRVNDPELDARLALEVFENQQRAIIAASPDLLASWHWLTTADGGVGFDRLFTALRRSPRPSAGEARDAVLPCLSGASCGTCAQSALDDADWYDWELAYALAWLSVAGSNSVMPPWVRHQFPGAGRLVCRRRDTSCDDSACEWCRERHDAHGELARWFGFDAFPELLPAATGWAGGPEIGQCFYREEVPGAEVRISLPSPMVPPEWNATAPPDPVWHGIHPAPSSLWR